MATLRVAFLSSMVLELLASLSVALVAVAIGLRLVYGELTLEIGLAVLILAPEAYLPLRQLGTQFHAAADGVAASATVLAVLDTPPPAPGTRTDVPAVPGLPAAGAVASGSRASAAPSARSTWTMPRRPDHRRHRDPAAPARPRCCSCWPACSDRTAGPSWWPAPGRQRRPG